MSRSDQRAANELHDELRSPCGLGAITVDDLREADALRNTKLELGQKLDAA